MESFLTTITYSIVEFPQQGSFIYGAEIIERLIQKNVIIF